MIAMTKQLYKLISKIPINDLEYFDELTGEIIGIRKVDKQFMFLLPSGVPYLPAEIFLNLELKKRVEETVKNKAGRISHFVRLLYAGNENNRRLGRDPLKVEELTNKQIENFSKSLLNGYSGDGYKDRNNNTVRTILREWVNFLEWYQSYFLLKDNFIGIDTKSKKHRIPLDLKIKKDNRGVKHTYKFFKIKIEPVTVLSQHPISHQIIKSLWDAHEVLKSEQGQKFPKKIKLKFTKRQLKEHSDFITARRDLILRILEALGARPHEIIHIPRVINEKNILNGNLFLFTAKQGNDRTVPIDQAFAIKLEVYLKVHIPKLEERLKKTGLIVETSVLDDCLLLNTTSGKVITAGTCYQLFRDIRVKAGIEEKACARMFRRRFITNMVKLHLSSFLTENPLKGKYSCNEDDYLGILKKITKVTGHKNPKSLLDYIELAWDELDVFSAANEAKIINDRLTSLRHELADASSLINDLSFCQKAKTKILAELSRIKELTIIKESNLNT